MCGEHLSHINPPLESGIIPACAGSTRSCRRWSRSPGDHPRMCGEHVIDQLATQVGQGSSPHVRGALQVTQVEREAVGIIPACAGSTRHDTCLPSLARDHPRMCGEHDNTQRHRRTDRGSSPHVRGSTKRHQWCWLICRDHPRMCGEHQIVAWNAGSTQGSSPHVRGAP